VGDECLSRLHLTKDKVIGQKKKTSAKKCEQIFGCLVISEDGKLSLSIHPWSDDAPGI